MINAKSLESILANPSSAAKRGKIPIIIPIKENKPNIILIVKDLSGLSDLV